GEADEMLGADVGGEDRGADQEPAGAAAREKVIGGVLFLEQGTPDADGRVRHEVERHDHPVERRKRNRRPRHGFSSRARSAAAPQYDGSAHNYKLRPRWD